MDIEQCPALDEERSALVVDEAGLRRAAPETPTLAVWLRDPVLPAVPACDGATGADRRATCAARDEPLAVRVDVGSKQLECILSGGLNLTDPLDLQRALAGSLKPIYWDEPYRFSDGKPVALLRAFSTGLTWTLVEQLARHPYVERLEAVPGDVPFLDTEAPKAPEDCPLEREDPAPKLVEAQGLQSAGRRPVAIRMKLDGIPEQVPCSSDWDLSSCAEVCDPFVFAEWERYLVSTRHLACVGRELDAVVGAGEYPVSYDGRVGSLCTPLLLGAGPMVVTEMGRALTWEEAHKVAAHPYVEAIQELDPGVAPGENEQCPLDLEAPIPAPECTTARESAAGKWTETSEAIWSASAEPHDVTIVVRGGATVCPAQECPAPPNPCPESGAQHEYMSEWNWQSQRCVRAALLDLGAAATDEHFWLANVMFAKLTWDQIQAVGAHPHVAAIDRDSEPTPPP